jgi:hypothetical protein
MFISNYQTHVVLGLTRRAHVNVAPTANVAETAPALNARLASAPVSSDDFKCGVV